MSVHARADAQVDAEWATSVLEQRAVMEAEQQATKAEELSTQRAQQLRRR